MSKVLKTADGVAFTPDMKLFYRLAGHRIVESTGVCRLYIDSKEASMNTVELPPYGGLGWHVTGRQVPINRCYSTREALEAAENE